MVRQRQPDTWNGWIEQACAAETAADLRVFANGLRGDEAAVRPALSLGWSNGQLEGQVNRLKTLKRQMYGRAKFDLLRERFLLAA